MPTITLSKKVLEGIIGKKLPLEKLKDRISMLGTDLESIEGDEIKVEIFPNRPDMLSEQGFARAFRSFLGLKTGLAHYTIKKSGMKVIVDPSVSMRPFTACALVKNVKFTDERIREIMQMQEKLAKTHGRNRKKSAYGIYPLDNIHFPIKYIAKDPKKVMFYPLGMDGPIRSDKVAEVHPKGREYKHISENWKKFAYFIDAQDNVMCMMPFTNSHDTGKVELDTTEVFIECTGTDQRNVEVALNMFVTMFADMGADVYSLDIVYKNKTITTPNMKPSSLKFDYKYINKILGLDLKEKEMEKLLHRMGLGYEKGKALIPAYRDDIIHPIDIAEDVAIAYGYENFEHVIPNVATIGEESPTEVLLNKLREVCIGLGLLELKNYHLTRKDDLTTNINQSQKVIQVKNAVGEHDYLRSTLMGGVLRVLAENKHHEFPQNLFEVGRTFRTDAKWETGIAENEHITLAFCHEKTDFTEIKQAADALVSALGLEMHVKEAKHATFIEGRVGKIYAGKNAIGVLGEVHPEVLTNFGLTMPVSILEIDVEAIKKLL